MITILRRRVVHNIWGCYLEGQGHSMTLQQNRIQPITSLFEVGFYNFFDKLLLCVQYLFGEHYPVRPALVKYVVIIFLKVRYSTSHFFTETHVLIIFSDKFFQTQNAVL